MVSSQRPLPRCPRCLPGGTTPRTPRCGLRPRWRGSVVGGLRPLPRCPRCLPGGTMPRTPRCGLRPRRRAAGLCGGHLRTSHAKAAEPTSRRDFAERPGTALATRGNATEAGGDFRYARTRHHRSQTCLLGRTLPEDPDRRSGRRRIFPGSCGMPAISLRSGPTERKLASSDYAEEL